MKGPLERMFRTRGDGGSSLLLGLAVAVLVTLAPSAGAQAGSGGIDPGLAAGWQGTEDSWRQHGPLPGITAAVQLSDGSTWKGVSGAARLPPNHIAVTADTPFLIASVTKTFVASTVLELVHDGRLSLRDTLSKWLPDFDRAERITVRMLLAHTSGIADIFDNPAFNRLVLKRPDHVWTFDEILSMVGAPHFAPGAAWEYSNTNYILLGRIVEMVTGNSVAQEIRQRFLDPLGLNDTWFQGEETKGPRTTAAIGYARTWHGWRPWAPHDSLRPSTSEATFVWSAGAMVSTARDLATWARDLYGGHVLAPDSLAQMLRFGSHRYGLGAERRTIGGRRAWGHGGSLEGFETSMWYLPSLDASIVVMWNRWPYESDYLANQLATRLVNTIDRDTLPPVVTAPRLAIDNGATVPLGRVPVIAWWHGHDRKGHIVRYQARLRRGTGAWRTVRLRHRLATSVALKITTGRAGHVRGQGRRWHRQLEPVAGQPDGPDEHHRQQQPGLRPARVMAERRRTARRGPLRREQRGDRQQRQHRPAGHLGRRGGHRRARARHGRHPARWWFQRHRRPAPRAGPTTPGRLRPLLDGAGVPQPRADRQRRTPACPGGLRRAASCCSWWLVRSLRRSAPAPSSMRRGWPPPGRPRQRW